MPDQSLDIIATQLGHNLLAGSDLAVAVHVIFRDENVAPPEAVPS